MDIHQYFLFVTIAFFYIISPGPAVFLSINYGAVYGLKKTTVMLLGNSTGLAVIATISALGVGALIVSSSVLLNATKVLGALVLCYLGVKMIFSALKIKQGKSKAGKAKKTELDTQRGYVSFYKEGLFLALSNPKAIIFFTAIYPQFVSKGKENVFILFLLGATFVVISYTCLNLYVVFGKNILSKLLDDTGMMVMNLVSGVVFIGMSVMMLLSDLPK